MERLLRQFLMTMAEAVIKPSPFQPGIKNSDGLKTDEGVSPEIGDERPSKGHASCGLLLKESNLFNPKITNQMNLFLA
jgi:hypothetical protein